VTTIILVIAGNLPRRQSGFSMVKLRFFGVRRTRISIRPAGDEDASRGTLPGRFTRGSFFGMLTGWSTV
jgi:hypothetical protein